ncbi:MAG: hypothetical protein GYB50_17185 [Rhodobacteraceae bacterium]|uniref:hypothetical protein n=1 Tax=Salipiger thiooxidans TaxID=282683 RepID=UPI001A8C627E|nr:hypothetical protein [Salipiger thiooxidans]MBN8190492.1 hypothetical protein [Salipiger thiooxidans]MBR9839614.1 hypothetical protein [Paracoccaceae bacterium]
MASFVSFWFALFGFFVGAAAGISAISRLASIGLSGYLAEVVEFYRGVTYPIAGFFAGLFGITLSPLAADLLSLYGVIALVFLRILILLSGVVGLLTLFNPFGVRAMIRRQLISDALGLRWWDTSFDLDKDEKSKFRFWVERILDYLILLLAFPLWPICVRYMWRNRFCFRNGPYIHTTDELHEPELLTFDFRAMLVLQLVAIFVAAIVFYILG